jgi:hypothetical protein
MTISAKIRGKKITAVETCRAGLAKTHVIAPADKAIKNAILKDRVAQNIPTIVISHNAGCPTTPRIKMQTVATRIVKTVVNTNKLATTKISLVKINNLMTVVKIQT